MIRALVLALLLMPSVGKAQDPNLPALRAAATLAVALPDSDAMLAACPADLYDSRANPLQKLLQPDWSDMFAACQQGITACATACISAQDGGGACLALGILLEQTEEPALDLPARRYHALACALGQPGACTNRGGGMRNAPVPGDPWWSAPIRTGAKDACLYRSFQSACAASDSWGCAMLGQAQQWGEGTPADPVAALRSYQRACDLVTEKTFRSCVFAREAIANLAPQPDVVAP